MTYATLELLMAAPCPSDMTWLTFALVAHPGETLPVLGRCGDHTLIQTLEDNYTGFFVGRAVKEAAVAAIAAIKARHTTQGGLSLAADGGGLSVSKTRGGLSVED